MLWQGAYRVLLGIALLGFFADLPLRAAPVRDGHVEAELVSSVQSIRAGESFWVALRLNHDPRWHTYWKNSTTGFATEITWELPDGFEAGEIQWPVPQVYELDTFVDYVFEGEIFLPVRITPPASLEPGRVTLQAKVEWLMCENVCIPGEAQLSLMLPVSRICPKLHSRWGQAIEETLVDLPRDLPEWDVFVSREGDALTLEVRPAADASWVDPGELYFFSPHLAVKAEPAQVQELLPEGGRRLLLTVAMEARDDLKQLVGVLASERGWEPAGIFGLAVDAPVVNVTQDAVSPNASGGELNPTPVPVHGFGVILLFAFLGGLILNLMPCVFPVIGIKIMGFVNQAGQARSKVALHGVLFSLGVLLSFWALAAALLVFRSAGEMVGWGFQFQSPVFVFLMAIFLFLFGLNMSGVFEVGQKAVSVGGVVQGKSGYSGSFLSGVVATIVATPCSAPFLAPALGVAIAQPPPQMFLIFSLVAVGLSFPYLLLSAFPALVRLLPRPGQWMESLKQFMAFLLYGTVAYLIWSVSGVLNNEAIYGAHGFFGVLLSFVLAGLAAWIYGRWSLPHLARSRRVAAMSVSAVVLLLAVAVGYPRELQARADLASGVTPPAFDEGATSPHFVDWQPGLPERLAAEGHTVFVDFTARWCATCQVNKKTIFSSDAVVEAFRKQQVIALRADWTARDAHITEELARYGKAAVPFNLVYKPGQAPLELPPVLTPGVVADALR